ncbi:MAG: hypothetical protein O9284_08765 [Steroidobacteraceae bacterium]|jgi:hypothetical protein|nr:hypothetical protein [Steroidobacteraceae bacterium]
MDRQGDLAPGSTFDVDADSPGWDAYAVWHARVHEPRHGAPAPSAVDPPRRFEVEEPGEGWDPLQTWQLRVRKARDGR